MSIIIEMGFIHTPHVISVGSFPLGKVSGKSKKFQQQIIWLDRP
jgi:hypothetical protein